MSGSRPCTVPSSSHVSSRNLVTALPPLTAAVGAAAAGALGCYVVYRAVHSAGLRRTQRFLEPVRTTLFNR